MNALPILAVDDDATFLRILQQSIEYHDLKVHIAISPEAATKLIKEQPFGYAILDLNLNGQSGLNLLQTLLATQPNCQVLILTGYASVATAVEAMRLGASDYLCKPASVDDILKSLGLLKTPPLMSDSETPDDLNTKQQTHPQDDFNAMSVKRLEWEHIQKVLVEHDGNITLTAQALNMHRRTLQRKLQKRPVEK